MRTQKSQTLIPIQRFINEKLEWKTVEVDLEEPYTDCLGQIYKNSLEFQIIDASGMIYRGIIEDDGRVTAFGGYGHYDSIKTYNGFEAAENAGMSKRYGPHARTRHHLHHNLETGEVFGRASASSGDEEIYSMNACDVVAWLFDIDNREEPITYDTDPRSVVIGLPIEIVNTIECQLPGDAIDWIRCILAEALGDIALAGPAVGTRIEGDPAFTAKQVRESLDRIKNGKASPETIPPAKPEEVVDKIKSKHCDHRKAD